jgi:hypothetical protein
MSSGGRNRGGVSEQEGRSDQTYKDGAADARGAARMASVNAPDTKNELTDGTVRSIDAATRAEIGPYRKSRLI